MPNPYRYDKDIFQKKDLRIFWHFWKLHDQARKKKRKICQLWPTHLVLLRCGPNCKIHSFFHSYIIYNTFLSVIDMFLKNSNIDTFQIVQYQKFSSVMSFYSTICKDKCWRYQRWQSLPFPWLLWAHPPSPGIRHLLSRHPAIMMMKAMMMVMLMMTMINDENQGIYLCKTEWIWILKDVSSRSLFCEGVNVSNNSDQSALRIQFGKLRRDICDKNGDNQRSQTEEDNQWHSMCIHRPR